MKTKRKSVSAKLLGLFTKSVDLQLPEINVENASFLAKNYYLEHIKRVKFCHIFDVFEKNVDKKEKSRRILKALFRPKTLIKMAFDCILVTGLQILRSKIIEKIENFLFFCLQSYRSCYVWSSLIKVTVYFHI